MNQLLYDETLLGQYPDTRLAQLTGCNVSFIWRQRIKRGIPSYSSVYGYLPRFNYNIKAFDVINEISAYWLGFYFADGCVCQTRRRKLVCFSVSDYEALTKLSNFYTVDVKLIKCNKQKDRVYYNLQLCNEYLFDKLVALGCVPKKTFIIDKPNIPEKFYLPFLMGFYDGDGGLSRNRSVNSWKAFLGTGSKLFFDWISNIVNGFGFANSIEIRKMKSGKPFYIICMMGITAKTFLGKLYGAVPSYLPLSRKKCLYEQLMETKLRGPNFFEWEIDYLKSELNDVQCSKAISSDPRNYGWIRSADCLRMKRKSLKF